MVSPAVPGATSCQVSLSWLVVSKTPPVLSYSITVLTRSWFGLHLNSYRTSAKSPSVFLCSSFIQDLSTAVFASQVVLCGLYQKCLLADSPSENHFSSAFEPILRSEERRVGKECRS